MAAERSKGNVTDIEARKAVRRGAAIVDDAAALADETIEAAEEALTPERRYSLNALVAVGLAGFVLGRLCSR